MSQSLVAVEHVSKILNTKKIRFTRLDEVLETVIPTNTSHNANAQVNIFIDLSSVIKQLYNPKLLNHFSYIKREDHRVIASELLNMIGHYRHYFSSRKKMYSNIFFYFSYAPSSYHVKVYPEYKEDYYRKRNNMKDETFGVLSNIIRRNLQLVKRIIKYVPNAYFIDTGSVEASIIPYIMTSEEMYNDPESYNLILTTDELHYQDLLVNDRNIILELRGSEKSDVVIYENLLDVVLEGNKKDPTDFPNVFPEDILLIDPMITHKDYGLTSIKRRGYATAMGAIEKLNRDDLLITDGYDIEGITALAPDLFPTDEEAQEEYKRNALLVNHQHYVDKFYEKVVNKIEVNLIDFDNIPDIREVNEKFFYKYPLTLEYIYAGEAERPLFSESI